MCERTPTFKTWICAAGFDNKRDIFLSEGAPKWKEEDEGGEGDEGGEDSGAWDAVTTFGLRIWQPSVGRWVEVSVNGNMHKCRPSDDVAGKRIGDSKAELEHGSIIDLSGVQLIFQDHSHMADNLPSAETLERFMGDFNSMQVQCPVNLQTIKYTRSQSTAGDDYWGVPGFHNSKAEDDLRPPSSTAEGKEVDAGSDLEEEDEEAAGIFPACGHLVTYSPSMASGLTHCPLCRQCSSLVPLSIAYTPAVTYGDTPPTHVFNPCGCAASEECVRFWSDIKISHPPVPGQSDVSICPYCGTTCSGTKPYARIITGHGVKIGKGGEVRGAQEEKDGE